MEFFFQYRQFLRRTTTLHYISNVNATPVSRYSLAGLTDVVKMLMTFKQFGAWSQHSQQPFHEGCLAAFATHVGSWQICVMALVHLVGLIISAVIYCRDDLIRQRLY